MSITFKNLKKELGIYKMQYSNKSPKETTYIYARGTGKYAEVKITELCDYSRPETISFSVENAEKALVMFQEAIIDAKRRQALVDEDNE